MVISSENEVSSYPSPDELWERTFAHKNEWSKKFDSISFAPFGGNKGEYYQEIAINNALDAIAEKQNRIY